jgi:uncharacterized protein (TIGR02145 family)
MKKQLTLALALATTLTLTACEEKKKQDGTTPEPAAATETQQPTQEAAQEAAEKPAENAGGNTLTDTRDGKTYKTVKIGEQVWMAENLNYETAERSNCYDDEEANCKKYGLLYELEAAKKACPSGWHLPSKAEWDKLVDFAGGKEIAGKYLKATSGWNENGNGEDKFGFAALPGGSTYDGGNMFANNVGGSSFWWSSSEDGDYHYYLEMSNIFNNVIYNTDKYELYSVRCIQN